jgi:hypothetical protein
MGRTIPSFRTVLAEEKAEWKPFRNALDKPERNEFDGMWDIPRLYVSACSNSVQYVRLHPILMSILLFNYKLLTECVSEVEQIEAKVNNEYGRRRLAVKKEQEEAADKGDEKSKALNQARDTTVLTPLQENDKKSVNGKKKLHTVAKQETPSLDSYFI